MKYYLMSLVLCISCSNGGTYGNTNTSNKIRIAEPLEHRDRIGVNDTTKRVRDNSVQSPCDHLLTELDHRSIDYFNIDSLDISYTHAINNLYPEINSVYFDQLLNDFDKPDDYTSYYFYGKMSLEKCYILAIKIVVIDNISLKLYLINLDGSESLLLAEKSRYPGGSKKVESTYKEGVLERATIESFVESPNSEIKERFKLIADSWTLETPR